MSQTRRFYALDVLRGLAIALMILVNTPGSWQHVYTPLLHAPWHGFTFADIVFPGFLFVVGAAMAFSMKQAPRSLETLQKILKRTVLMFMCGLFLNWFWLLEWDTLRIMGVLQRIALAYGVAAFMVLYLPKTALLPSALALLAIYFGLLQLGETPYELAGNWVRQVDLAVFGPAHLYQGFGLPFDPEGLVSTIPAVFNVLIGFWVADKLQAKTPEQGIRWLAKVGAGLVITAVLLSLVWPINKALWTGSYALLAAGLLVWLLAMLVYAVDIRQFTQLTEPLRIYGTNPLFIYMLSFMWSMALGRLLHLEFGGEVLSVSQFLFGGLALAMPPKVASLCFALSHVLLFWWVSKWLYQRHIFIKL